MIALSPEQLFKRIQSEGFRSVTFYSGLVSNPKESKSFFWRFRNEDVNTVEAAVREVLNEYPYAFTVMAYNKHNGSAEPPAIFMVDPYKSANGSAPMNGHGLKAGQFGSAPAVSEEEMYQRVLLKIKDEMERDNLKRELEFMKQQLNGFQSVGGRLAFVGEQILTSILNKNPKFQATMQGLNAPVMEENKDIEKTEKKQELAEALSTLVNVLGEDTFIAVAKKLKEDPQKAALIKTFL
jgi:hypothetical protein